jgi:hypothetical protein
LERIVFNPDKDRPTAFFPEYGFYQVPQRVVALGCSFMESNGFFFESLDVPGVDGDYFDTVLSAG